MLASNQKLKIHANEDLYFAGFRGTLKKTVSSKRLFIGKQRRLTDERNFPGIVDN